MKPDITRIGKHVLRSEADAILALEDKLDTRSFEKALGLLQRTKGKIVISGMGKSGIVARKIAGTLSSTGTFSLFVHPVEALHGDLGMVSRGDIIVVISHSGKTKEALAFVNAASHLKNKLIVITAHEDSPLAKRADVALATHVREEACKICKTFNMAPTASSIVSLALGDALAAALQEVKGFGLRHFAKVHRGGTLGRQKSIQ